MPSDVNLDAVKNIHDADPQKEPSPISITIWLAHRLPGRLAVPQGHHYYVESVEIVQALSRSRYVDISMKRIGVEKKTSTLHGSRLLYTDQRCVIKERNIQTLARTNRN